MSERFVRTKSLIGTQALEKLSRSRVCVFGVGGVGSYVTEALARSGVGVLDLVDSDTVGISNINRQLIALDSTLGKYKVDVARDRILDINPEAVVNVHKCFYLPDTAADFDFENYDYVVDAIDTVTAKIDIICRCSSENVPVISSMGTGNKLDPTKIEVTDIYKTDVDPLAKVMRRELRKRGIEKLKVVYSSETPHMPIDDIKDESHPGRRGIPGSVSFVPSVAGLILAGEVIKDLIKEVDQIGK